jgi:ferrochelatase
MPATSERIEALARGGTQRLLVTMPGFLSDGLKSLEEIGVEGCNSFLVERGSEFHCALSAAVHPDLVKSLLALS